MELGESYCLGKTNIIYERYCFNNRNQDAGKSIDTYAWNLGSPDDTCNFGPLKEDTIRDKPRRGTKGGGGGGLGRPLEFLICCSISKRFYLQWKAFDLLNKMRYISWVVALLEALTSTIMVATWPPSWILPRIRKQVETARNGNVLCLTWKITHKWALCIILPQDLLLLLKKVEKHVLSLKNGLTTCYVWHHISEP